MNRTLVGLGPIRRLALAAVLTACLLSATGPARSESSPGATRVMLLGDSITGSPGCWRALLWQRLLDGGYGDVDFVGTLPPRNCGGLPHDGDHEGHSGYRATGIADRDQLPDWLAATDPDVVVMHLGTNDVWRHVPNDEVLDAFTTLVEQMRDHNPQVRVLVAQIIPMAPANCPGCARQVAALNAEIPGWARSMTTARSPVTVVDQWTGFDTATDTRDGVHPTPSGDRKIADRWYPPLAAALAGGA
ncbi:hypothetical protein AQ490_18740 [Wenjunlia vitaminophila]|uniref:SGNH hydrolase-type esterase domain-containing protein n=1 Tax=Wenjunlia vitaminophila TaxID=76728 RepID=A0A0T6LVK2_WENVI|nr:SGNH/GDSL hydrolase family protein [Wenjunlia vitaminophila]KRV49740.1 hypothetical protein AQ490_18740 [Wenjunlia vitaminophila]